MHDLFSNFGMRLFRYAKNRQDQGGPMPIVTAAVLSMVLLTVTGCVTGCVTASEPSARKQETGKKDFSSFSGEGPGFESQPAHHFVL
jgi:hypothetical protein